MEIQRASISDSSELTKLTKKSKAFWGYSSIQIAKWSNELTITQNYIRENQVFKLIEDKVIIGFYSYYKVNEDVIKLENLFISPNKINNGFGKLLINNFLKNALDCGIKKVTLDSDPNAKEFYTKFGFKVVGKLKSTIKNRYLPVMEKELKD